MKNARKMWIRHFIFDFLTKIDSYRTMVTTIMNEMVYTELSSMKREKPVRLDRHTMVSEYLETADEDVIFRGCLFIQVEWSSHHSHAGSLCIFRNRHGSPRDPSTMDNILRSFVELSTTEEFLQVVASPDLPVSQIRKGGDPTGIKIHVAIRSEYAVGHE